MTRCLMTALGPLLGVVLLAAACDGGGGSGTTAPPEGSPTAGQTPSATATGTPSDTPVGTPATPGDGPQGTVAAPITCALEEDGGLADCGDHGTFEIDPALPPAYDTCRLHVFNEDPALLVCTGDERVGPVTFTLP